MLQPLRWLWIVMVMAVLAGPAFALTEGVLVGPDLAPRRVQIQGLADGVISYFDGEGHYQHQPLDRFVQLRLGAAGASSEAAPAVAAEAGSGAASRGASGGASGGARMVLTDGQRLPGRWAGAAEEGQRIVWEHPLFGRAAVSLDDIRQVVLDPSLPLETGGSLPTTDRVHFTNGDVLEGFVETVGEQAVGFLPEGQARALRFPLERIAALEIAAAPPPDRPRRHNVRLADGSEVRVEGLTLHEGALVLQGTLFDEGGRWTVDPAKVRSVDLAGEAGRLADLLALPREVTAGGQAFGRAFPPQPWEGGLLLRAPLTLRLALPAGAKQVRFAARVPLLPGDLPGALAWSDFGLRVRQGEQVLAAAHLSQAEPACMVNVAVAAGDLILELDAGLNGPVMDRLLIEEGVVLVGEVEGGE